MTLSQPSTPAGHGALHGGATARATGGTKAGTGADYKIKSGTVTFKPAVATGLTPISKTISISVFGDTDAEGGRDVLGASLDTPDRRLRSSARAPGPGPAAAPPGCATGTILNDDVASGFTLGIGDGSIFSARSGKQNLKLPVTLSGKADHDGDRRLHGRCPASATCSKKSTEGGDFGGKRRAR